MNVKELLVREPVRVAAGVGELEQRTLERAKDALGYTSNDQRLAHSNKIAAQLFANVGIEQFTPGSVAKYKDAMLAAVNAKARVANFFANGGGIPITVLSCVATFALTTISVVSYFDASDTPGAHPFFYAMWQWLAIPAILTAIFSIACACMDETEYEWNRVALEKYIHAVPYFALSRALEIREHYEDAKFYVESLEARQRKLIDPFLVVAIEGYLYYVDVWDEPKFEGRRVK